MKTTDILSELENVKDKYKEEAREENAEKYFSKGKGKKIFKYVLSAAALFALAAFAAVTVMTKYMNKPDRMVSHGASVVHEIKETTIKQETLKPDGSHESWAELKFDECTLKGGEPQKADILKPDYLMTGGSHMFKTYYDYTTEGGKDSADIIKSKDGEEVWRYTWYTDPDSGLQYTAVRPLDSGVLLTAHDYIGYKDIPNTLAMIMLDDDGREIWNKKYDHQVGRIVGVYYDTDTIYVIGYSNTEVTELKDDGIDWIVSEQLTSVNISEYSRTTGELYRHKEIPVQIDFSSESIRCIGKTEFGYVIMYYTLNPEYKENLLLVSYEDGIRAVVGFGDTYEFCSASSLNGKIYLSGKRMSPGRNMGADAYFYNREWTLFYHKYSYAWEHNGSAIKESSELLAKYSEETSAVLLVCDGYLSPEQTYTQNAAYGGALNKTETGLEWDAVQISAVYTSAYTDEYPGEPIVAGSSRTYSVSEEGLITSVDETARSYVMVGVYYPYE